MSQNPIQRTVTALCMAVFFGWIAGFQHGHPSASVVLSPLQLIVGIVMFLIVMWDSGRGLSERRIPDPIRFPTEYPTFARDAHAVPTEKERRQTDQSAKLNGQTVAPPAVAGMIAGLASSPLTSSAPPKVEPVPAPNLKLVARTDNPASIPARRRVPELTMQRPTLQLAAMTDSPELAPETNEPNPRANLAQAKEHPAGDAVDPDKSSRPPGSRASAWKVVESGGGLAFEKVEKPEPESQDPPATRK